MADPNANLTAAIANLNNQMATLVNAIQPLLQAQAANANAPAAAAVTFATTPGTYSVTDLIDYSTRTGTNLYEQGTKSLYEDEEKFSLQNEKAPAFMREVKARVKKMGWDNDTQGITHLPNRW
jgi:hypothetical protein